MTLSDLEWPFQHYPHRALSLRLLDFLLLLSTSSSISEHSASVGKNINSIDTIPCKHHRYSAQLCDRRAPTRSLHTCVDWCRLGTWLSGQSHCATGRVRDLSRELQPATNTDITANNRLYYRPHDTIRYGTIAYTAYAQWTLKSWWV